VIRTLTRYMRDAAKREADFLLMWEGKSWMLVESRCWSTGSLDALRGFREALGVKERYMVTLEAGCCGARDGGEVFAAGV
jgi:hypothetical protein